MERFSLPPPIETDGDTSSRGAGTSSTVDGRATLARRMERHHMQEGEVEDKRTEDHLEPIPFHDIAPALAAAAALALEERCEYVEGEEDEQIIWQFKSDDVLSGEVTLSLGLRHRCYESDTYFSHFHFMFRPWRCRQFA